MFAMVLKGGRPLNARGYKWDFLRAAVAALQIANGE
jgi:hypothetical protein